MNRVICLYLIILSFNSWAQSDTSKGSISNFLDLDIPSWIKANNTPGISIAIIENGKVINQQNYGYANDKERTLVTNETGFNVGSISKVITMWGVLKLIDQGRIHLDSSANIYLNKWTFPTSKFSTNKITIRSLLNHTSGLSVHGYPGYKKMTEMPSLVESLSGVPKKSTRVELKSEPGCCYRYSGGGYSVLQLIIEEVTGDRFSHYIDTAVLTPLGMTNSGFDINEELLANTSKCYNKRGKQIPYQYFTAQAAAGFQTTMDDFIKFILAYFQSSGNGANDQIISDKFLDQMFSVGENNRSKLGLQLYRSGSMVVFGHGGINAGWGSVFGIDPKNGDAFIMLTNSYRGKSISDYALQQWLDWKELKGNDKYP